MSYFISCKFFIFQTSVNHVSMKLWNYILLSYKSFNYIFVKSIKNVV